ncbi:MAG: hypothetical protein ACTS5I_02565 [Rhodanobacter sp.]
MTQRKGLKALEAKINGSLAAMPADRRPEMSTRRRVQSVAYSSRGAFEATDSDGHVEFVLVDVAAKWVE